MAVKIVTAKLRDLKIIRELNHGLFIYEEGTFNPKYNCRWPYEKQAASYFKKRIEDAKSLTLLAKIDDRNIGYLIGRIIKTPSWRTCGKMAELDSVFVLEDFRNKGVGDLLIQEFFLWCKTKK